MNNNLNVSPEVFKIERLQLQLDEIQSTELGKKIFSDWKKFKERFYKLE